ncbi:OPT super [Ancistrocladus abbreviatus]
MDQAHQHARLDRRYWEYAASDGCELYRVDNCGFLSGYVAYRYAPEWWKRHNYLLSGALDAGLAFMGVALYLCLGLEDISLSWWGNDIDGCPLAICPTEKGVAVKGCPVVY